jgi:hypothetical protein
LEDIDPRSPLIYIQKSETEATCNETPHPILTSPNSIII